ncbi:uncharacterized protein N7473_008524 [Penicillium subrubescens]|uniref:uncharacterized protein n=1 Tax=Penicillium subrubescens TaxID=1316194 RepID=UPI002544E93C|nr:uncharacterized protein N7473_008524 [Penicillium subrubescens]KAJ5892296.1 hypothetical protein N7473_008524 [Penicillium subrubescens]
MFVAGFEASGRVTISNSEFDGQTTWSASCDGHHYWTVLGYGKNDKVTFTGNYIHHTSGRSPKLEFNSYWHVYNNFWFNNTGHAFDVGEGTKALIEGNVFQQVKTPFLEDSSPGKTFAVTSSDKSTCDSKLGRTCAVNTFTSSGTLSAGDETVLSSWPSGESGIDVLDADQVKSSVLSNAGIGKLSSSSSSRKVRQFDVPAPLAPVLSSADPGATPCATPSGAAPT